MVWRNHIFEIHNGLKQGDALSPLLFNFVLEHAIKSLEDKEGVQLNGIHKLLVYADDIVLLGDSEEILKDNMHILRSSTRKLRLEINVNKTKYMVTRRNASSLITNRNEIQKEIKHRKIFGPKRDEETGEWRRLHNTELKDFMGNQIQ
ncbi:hypothetical protein C0J52_09825 [Blattella germanica]|nr:hypothetical protein C0J52_09825 [Blattella germanica]